MSKEGVSVTQYYASQEGSDTDKEPLKKLTRGKRLTTIAEGPDGIKEEIGQGMTVLNDYEELEKGEGGYITRIKFNGKELSVGQKVEINDAESATPVPAGTKATIKMFDPGSDAWTQARSLWVIATTEDGQKFQGDPFNFVGYEDTRLEK